MSVVDDPQFLPSTPDPQYALTSSASADPFHADWPHWDAPIPPWLVRS